MDTRLYGFPVSHKATSDSFRWVLFAFGKAGRNILQFLLSIVRVTVNGLPSLLFFFPLLFIDFPPLSVGFVPRKNLPVPPVLVESMHDSRRDPH